MRGFFARSNNASLPFTVTKHASEQTQLHCYEGVEATSNRKTQARTRSQSTLRSRRDAEEKEMNRKKKEKLGSVAKLDAHKTRRASRCHLYPFFPPLILSFSPFQFERVKGLAVHSLFVLVFLLPLLADPAFTFFFLLLHRVCVCVRVLLGEEDTHGCEFLNEKAQGTAPQWTACSQPLFSKEKAQTSLLRRALTCVG